MTAPVMEGAEPWSAIGSRDAGALVIHGFTGNPSSMRGLAEAFAAAGFHVELPRLSGHGTSVSDMVPTRWSHWTADVDSAYATLASRCSRVVVAGLSMGGALTLWLGGRRPEVAGLVCINPATMPLPDEMMAGIEGLIAADTETIPAIGSDIADPEVKEIAYDATPLAPLRSMFVDGVGPLSTTYPSMRAPLLLFSSINDHVVDPAHGDHLAATYGGPLERVMLERSFHVATQDYDRERIEADSVAFAARIVGA